MTIENFFGRLNEDGLFADQIVDHRGLSEIYVHLGATIWLFVAAIIAIIVIWATFGRREQGWLALTSGIFSVGLIGAALRLGVIGHTDAQAMLARVHPDILELTATPCMGLDEICAFSPQQEIAVMRHETMSYRLFIN